MILFFSACSRPAARLPVPPAGTAPSIGSKALPPGPKKQARQDRPYEVNGRWYFPVQSVDGYQEQGICSWYGPDFHGKRTSSGETYNMFDYTAAHRVLPFNTQVRIRNPMNNKEVQVRINDRGPFVKERIIDLSYQSAKELGLIGPGTAWIELEALGIIEEIEENGQKIAHLVQEVDFQSGNFWVQVGSFKEYDNAYRLKERLSKEYPEVEISETDRSGERFFRVRLNRNGSLNEALRLQKELDKKGFSQALVIAQ